MGRPIDDVAQRVDTELLAFIATERKALEPEAVPLLDELESLIGSGGKRLRPRFAYWGYRTAGGGADRPEIMQIGAALELLHTMAMIQDDVMDRSATRRNRPSVHERIGASGAILAGMLGFVLADRLFGTHSAAVNERYHQLRTHAIAGQYLDVESARHGGADEATALRIAELKSGAYTVADPLAIGALLAGAGKKLVASLEAFGRPIGIAFQVRDDVLGTFGDPASTGKDADGDIREGKQTVLLAKAYAKATDTQRAMLDTKEPDAVREVMVAAGALEEANTLIAKLTEQAHEALLAARIDDDARAALIALADEATDRHA
jgi:geranylgeranyl diphosphate synthase, type I